MSIFGPEACSTEEGEVKIEYVDIQDSLWVLKVGDNMTGTLQMNGNLIRGLPKNYPPMYSGDEAISWEQAVGLIQDAVVNQSKRVITVWAELKRGLDQGRYQWSFGDTGGRYNQKNCGYTMLAPGRVIRMGLGAVVDKDATVCLVRNGEPEPTYCVTKPNDQLSGTVIFSLPLELAMGDVLNFRTETNAANGLRAVVSLLIELDF